LSGLDWLIVVIIVVSALMAAARGFFVELFSLVGVIFGYLLAVWEYWRVAPYYLPYVKTPWAADAAGFLTIFFAVVVVSGVIAHIVRWAVKSVGLSFVDRILGASFGLLRGVLMVTVLVLGLAAFPKGSEALANSELAPYFLVVGRAAIWVAPSDVRARFHDGLDALRKMREKQELKPENVPTK